MALIVQKFGGTSVGSPDKIKAVAERVLKKKKEGNQMVIVLSAMSGETNRLTDFAMQMQDIPDPREMDVLLSSGEQVTVSLFSMAVKAREETEFPFSEIRSGSIRTTHTPRLALNP